MPTGNVAIRRACIFGVAVGGSSEIVTLRLQLFTVLLRVFLPHNSTYGDEGTHSGDPVHLKWSCYMLYNQRTLVCL